MKHGICYRVFFNQITKTLRIALVIDHFIQADGNFHLIGLIRFLPPLTVTADRAIALRKRSLQQLYTGLIHPLLRAALTVDYV